MNTTSSRWFVNGDGEEVLELSVKVGDDLSAVHRWSGETALQAANKVGYKEPVEEQPQEPRSTFKSILMWCGITFVLIMGVCGMIKMGITIGDDERFHSQMAVLADESALLDDKRNHTTDPIVIKQINDRHEQIYVEETHLLADHIRKQRGWE